MAQMASVAAKTMTPISASRLSTHGSNISPSAGFTLLEILLVLAILGLASVLVVPNLGSLDNRTFAAQVRQASALLNFARRDAVVLGQPRTASFYSEYTDPDEFPAAMSSVGQWQASSATEMRFRDSTEQETDEQPLIEISFYPEGGSTGGTLVLEQGERRVLIAIDPFTGRVTTTSEDD